MPKPKVKTETCGSCGSDVRVGTQFCYNCGKNLTGVLPVIEDDPQAVDDATDPETPTPAPAVETRVKTDKTKSDKLAKAASARKKSRNEPRQARRFSWEPADDSPGLMIALAVIVFIISVTVVLFTVVWK